MGGLVGVGWVRCGCGWLVDVWVDGYLDGWTCGCGWTYVGVLTCMCGFVDGWVDVCVCW